MRRKHAELIEHERKNPAGLKTGYAGFLAEMERLRTELYQASRETGGLKQPSVNEVIAAFNDAPAEEFTTPYTLSDDGLEQVSNAVQRKYVLHFKNIRRSWSLLLQHMPELLVGGGRSRDVLEMSTAHGATLEILRHFGHRAIGNDFANFLGRRGGPDSRIREVNELDLTAMRDDQRLNTGDGTVASWPYQPIIESLDLDVRLFDAGHVPYPFEAKSFDTVLCFDAIDHYCHPKDWMVIIEEFTRLARQSILLVLNPINQYYLADPDYLHHFEAFQTAMRRYDKGGFQCVHAGLYRNQLTIFKLMRIGAPEG